MTDADKKLIAELDKLITNPPSSQHRIIRRTITPAVAKYLLDKYLGTHNRPENSGKKKKLAFLMGLPDWNPDLTILIFSDRGLLLDGQHRLRACILSGLPFTTDIRFGTDHKSFRHVDNHRTRNTADVLVTAGVDKKIAEHAGRALRWAELIATDRVEQRTTFDAPISPELLAKHRDVLDWFEEAKLIHKQPDRPPIGMVMAFLYHADKIDPDLAADLADAWGGKKPDQRMAPMHRVGQRVAELKGKTVPVRVRDTQRLAWWMEAWNAIRDDNPQALVTRWRPGKKYPKMQ